MGWDDPKVVDLGDGRSMWLVNDPYVDPAGRTPLRPDAYLHNTAIVQDGPCFSVVQRMGDGRPIEFAPDLPNGDFFWPLGGTVDEAGVIWVFWSEMRDDPDHPFLDGITRHPVATWLAAYDPQTLITLQFQRAPDAGVQPQYGSAVQTWGDFTYLFGNSNMLDLTREGGYDAGPFSGTRMYLARVPAGQLAAQPEYFTGGGWSSSASAARPYWTRWYASNAMQPRVIDGQWFSVVKQDEFWGDTVVVETADVPWGPWTTVQRLPAVPRLPPDRAGVWMTTYQPILLPQRGDDGRLIAVLSQNASIWQDAIADPRLYRPQALRVRG
jgi:hypothetical protein